MLSPLDPYDRTASGRKRPWPMASTHLISDSQPIKAIGIALNSHSSLSPKWLVSRVFLEFMLVYFQLKWLISMLSQMRFEGAFGDYIPAARTVHKANFDYSWTSSVCQGRRKEIPDHLVPPWLCKCKVHEGTALEWILVERAAISICNPIARPSRARVW